jgi:glucose/mannose-6-phosphate isomerase
VVNRGYALPSFVGAETLCIISSYSGNTEEALAVFEQAIEKECRIVVITSGGELLNLAQENNLPVAHLPVGLPPRLATFYMYRAVLECLDETDLIEQLEEAAEWLVGEVEQWRPDVAEEVAGKSLVIYAASFLSTSAYKWKIGANENAKNIAFYNTLPEFNHNEMMGWVAQPVQKPYAIVWLRSELYDSRVEERFELTKKKLSGRLPFPNEISVQGQNRLEQLLWALLLGDFTTIYLALVNNVDPADIGLMDQFKQDL